jgi:hypothetical protein
MAKKAHASPPVEIDIQIERWPIERLIPRANNPRTGAGRPHRGIDARVGLDKPDFGGRPTTISWRGTHVFRQPRNSP